MDCYGDRATGANGAYGAYRCGAKELRRLEVLVLMVLTDS